METVTLLRTDASHPDFISLVKLLDADLAVRDGEEHAFYHQYNHLTDIKHAMLAYAGGSVVSCGAFKPYSKKQVEIKRMFTLPHYRGKGIAQQVLQGLESWAKECGYDEAVLETGKKQPEAIRLYERCGYLQIPNYGQYVGVDNSVCMSKAI